MAEPTPDAMALPPGVTPAGTPGRILREALRLFAADGFAATSIRRIGAAAGINPATMYAHYPSKEHVLAELVRIGHEEMLARLTEALGSCEPDDVRGRLAALVRAHARLHTDHPTLAVVTNTELHALSPALAAGPIALRAASRRLLIDVLERGQAGGVFDIPAPDLAAHAISAMNMNIATWFTADHPHTRDRIAETHAAFALRLVASSAA